MLLVPDALDESLSSTLAVCVDCTISETVILCANSSSDSDLPPLRQDAAGQDIKIKTKLKTTVKQH
jgi:hypothetical protein